MRYRDVFRQIIERNTTAKTMSAGIQRFIIGLAKKVLIANTLASFVDQVFELPLDMLSTGVAWLGIVCYALQIYFDFSGILTWQSDWQKCSVLISLRTSIIPIWPARSESSGDDGSFSF